LITVSNTEGPTPDAEPESDSASRKPGTPEPR